MNHINATAYDFDQHVNQMEEHSNREEAKKILSVIQDAKDKIEFNVLGPLRSSLPLTQSRMNFENYITRLAIERLQERYDNLTPKNKQND